MTNETTPAPNFIRNQVRDEIEGGQVTKIVTAFSPRAERFSAHRPRKVDSGPNFGFGGNNGVVRCRLRFMTPTGGKTAGHQRHREDVSWLGVQLGGPGLLRF